MTTPITNPSVHQVPAKISKNQSALSELQQRLAALPNEILINLVNGILKALGMPDAEIESIDESILQVETALSNLFNNVGNSTNNWAMLLAGLGLGNITSLSAWLTNIELASTDAWNQLSDFLHTGNWDDLTNFWNDILQILFGSPTQTGWGFQIPSTAIGNVTQNLQPLYDFPHTLSVSGGSDWEWDGTVDHTLRPGSGSARTECDGLPKELVGVLTPVQTGQKVNVEGYVKYSGLMGATRVGILVIPQGAPEQLVAAVASPAGTSDWVHISGTYTVPEDVTRLQVALVATAASGTVWFDDCPATLTGGFFGDLENDWQEILDSFKPGGTAAEFNEGINNIISLFGLTSVLGNVDVTDVWTFIVNDIVAPLNLLVTSEQFVALQGDFSDLHDEAEASSEAFAALLNSWWTTLTATGLSFEEMFTQLDEAWQTYVETNKHIIDQEWVTLGQLFNHLFGINPTTGQLQQVQDIKDDLNSFGVEVAAGQQAFADLLDNWWDDFTHNSLPANNEDQWDWPTMWAHVETHWQQYIAANDKVQDAESKTLQKLFNDILGIDPATGRIPQSKIDELEEAGQNWTAMSENIQNFLLTWNWNDLTAAWKDLNIALWGGTSGNVGTSLQHGAMPSSWTNLQQDLLNLFNDVIFASGRGWDDIGDDLTSFINHLLGGTASHQVTPGQIPPVNVGGVNGTSNIGDSVNNAHGAATSAGNDAAAIGSQVGSVTAPAIPKAPKSLSVVGVSVPSGHPGVGQAGDDIWYRVTATNASGESTASNATYLHATFGPVAPKLSWTVPSGSNDIITVYRGIASNPFLIFPAEPLLNQKAAVGSVVTWTDYGD